MNYVHTVVTNYEESMNELVSMFQSCKGHTISDMDGEGLFIVTLYSFLDNKELEDIICEKEILYLEISTIKIP